MPEIEVSRAPDDAGEFEVIVRDPAGETRHRVTVTDRDWDRLGAGYGNPESLLRACFEFLLAREPKESILQRFDISVISRYFPEFEEEIRR